ncbi:MAG: hypothetical protein Fur002_18180 [Anaerolineales bacterium]
MNQTSEILEISEVSARVPNLSVPLAALALIGGAGALVAESKRRKGEGLTEAQRRVGQVSDLPNLIRAGGESSARFPNLSVPLAAQV